MRGATRRHWHWQFADRRVVTGYQYRDYVVDPIESGRLNRAWGYREFYRTLVGWRIYTTKKFNISDMGSPCDSDYTRRYQDHSRDCLWQWQLRR